MRRWMGLAPLALLAACGSLREPRVRTVEVRVPVRMGCAPADLPAAPSGYADDALPTAADAAAERYRQIATANEQRRARLAIVEPVVAACQ